MDCPKDFVDLEVELPQIERVMAYAGPSNFTGAPLPGYSGTRAWLHKSCLTSLRQIVADCFRGFAVFVLPRKFRSIIEIVQISIC